MNGLITILKVELIRQRLYTSYLKCLVVHYICQLNYQHILLVLYDTSPQQKCTSVLRVKNITLYKYRRNKEFFRNVMLFNILRVKHAAWQ